MRVLIAAGGTGGHIFPALAVAESLSAQGAQVSWVGTADRMEAQLVPLNGFQIDFIRFSGVRGKGALSLVLLPLRLLRAFWDAFQLLAARAPDLVLVFGGYVSFPVGLMASLRNITLVIHEQNAVAGSANRALAPIADAVLTAFPNVMGKAHVVGNPIRAALTQLPDPETRFRERVGPLRLLVMGGSLGAAALNKVVPEALSLIPQNRRPEVVHQSGEKHLEALQQAYSVAGVEARAVAFIDDVAAVYGWADVVIARSGATTVFELAAVGLPAIFVPYPLAIDDHQTANARWLVADALTPIAWLCPQSDLSAASLAKLLSGISRDDLALRAARARKLSPLDAAGRVTEICLALIEKRKKRS